MVSGLGMPAAALEDGRRNMHHASLGSHRIRQDCTAVERRYSADRCHEARRHLQEAHTLQMAPGRCRTLCSPFLSPPSSSHVCCAAGCASTRRRWYPGSVGFGRGPWAESSAVRSTGLSRKPCRVCAQLRRRDLSGPSRSPYWFDALGDVQWWKSGLALQGGTGSLNKQWSEDDRRASCCVRAAADRGPRSGMNPEIMTSLASDLE